VEKRGTQAKPWLLSITSGLALLLVWSCAEGEPTLQDGTEDEAIPPPAAVCGNDDTEDGEDCDDGANGDDDDGCTDECTFTCVADLDCNDLNACNGNETCVADTHVCIAGTPITCDDANFCTDDACLAASDNTYECSNTLIDEDEDGFAPGDCPERETQGGDCDDHNKRVHPGQQDHFLVGYGEFGDNFDYNCDGEESWADDMLCSSPDCCEIWQDSFMNPDFEPPVCGASGNRVRKCIDSADFWIETRPCR
jgi:hypothetical protein